jgi:hypothetical protein
MPFEIRRSGSKFCVFTQGTDHNHGCHPTRASAGTQLRALYANVKDATKAVADGEGGNPYHDDEGRFAAHDESKVARPSHHPSPGGEPPPTVPPSGPGGGAVRGGVRDPNRSHSSVLYDWLWKTKGGDAPFLQSLYKWYMSHDLTLTENQLTALNKWYQNDARRRGYRMYKPGHKYDKPLKASEAGNPYHDRLGQFAAHDESKVGQSGAEVQRPKRLTKQQQKDADDQAYRQLRRQNRLRQMHEQLDREYAEPGQIAAIPLADKFKVEGPNTAAVVAVHGTIARLLAKYPDVLLGGIRVATPEEQKYAFGDAYADYIGRMQGRVVRIHPDWVSTPDVITARWDRLAERKWFTDRGDHSAMEACLTHEFGHAMYDTLRSREGFSKMPSPPTAALSTYAVTNEEEAFAEAFAWNEFHPTDPPPDAYTAKVRDAVASFEQSTAPSVPVAPYGGRPQQAAGPVVAADLWNEVDLPWDPNFTMEGATDQDELDKLQTYEQRNTARTMAYATGHSISFVATVSPAAYGYTGPGQKQIEYESMYRTETRFKDDTPLGPGKGPTPEFKAFIAKNRRMSDMAAAAARGMPLSDYHAKVDAQFKTVISRALDSGGVFTRVTPSTLEKIIDSGEGWKTQLELKAFVASKEEANARREMFESLFLGYDKSPAYTDQHPVYGYVSDDPEGRVTALSAGIKRMHPEDDWLDGYGHVAVKVKPSVYGRTTIMGGDLMDYGKHMMNYPSPLLDPDGLTTPLCYGWYVDSPEANIEMRRKFAEHGNLDILDDEQLTGSWLERATSSWGAKGYVEAQFHGGLTMDDVEAVVFSKKPPARLRKKLEAMAIPYSVVDPTKGVAEHEESERQLEAMREKSRAAAQAAVAARKAASAAAETKAVDFDSDLGEQGNPYHDRLGRFAPRDESKVGRSGAEPQRVLDRLRARHPQTEGRVESAIGGDFPPVQYVAGAGPTAAGAITPREKDFKKTVGVEYDLLSMSQHDKDHVFAWLKHLTGRYPGVKTPNPDTKGFTFVSSRRKDFIKRYPDTRMRAKTFAFVDDHEDGGVGIFLNPMHFAWNAQFGVRDLKKTGWHSTGGPTKDDQLRHVMLHEFGHVVRRMYFSPMTITPMGSTAYDQVYKASDKLSKYALKNKEEAFAEAFAWLEDPENAGKPPPDTYTFNVREALREARGEDINFPQQKPTPSPPPPAEPQEPVVPPVAPKVPPPNVPMGPPKAGPASPMDITKELANPFADPAATFMQKYPRVKVDFPYTPTATSRKLITAFDDLMTKYPGMDQPLAYPYGEYAPFNRITGDASGDFDRWILGTKTFAATKMTPNKGTRILFNPDYYSTPLYAIRMREGKEKGWNADFPDGKEAEAVAAHEFGHVVRNWLLAHPQTSTYDRNWLMAEKSEASLSRYALESPAESFAEAFAWNYFHPNEIAPSAYASSVRSLLDKSFDLTPTPPPPRRNRSPRPHQRSGPRPQLCYRMCRCSRRRSSSRCTQTSTSTSVRTQRRTGFGVGTTDC